MPPRSLSEGLRKALDGAENPYEALTIFVRQNPPGFNGERDALCEAAAKALKPHVGVEARRAAFGIVNGGGMASGKPVGPSAGPSVPSVVRLSDVTPERVSWLWPGRIPLGKLTILDGDPGLGKSTLTLDLAARLSNGDAFPDGTRPDLDKVAGTVLLTAEDGLGDTVRPRLDAMGANPELIVALQAVEDRLPSVEDLDAIEAAVRAVGARLVVLDPLMAYLGEHTNAHRDQDVRRALAPLADLADRCGVAIVLVRHLNKSGGPQAIYRGGGSIGIIGAARAGLLVATDPDDETRRIFAPVKANLGAPGRALAFTVESAANGAARIRWQGETAHRADQLLAVPTEEERTARESAADVILDLLDEGPADSGELFRRVASWTGASRRTIERALSKVGAISERVRDADGRITGCVYLLPSRHTLASGGMDAPASSDCQSPAGDSGSGPIPPPTIPPPPDGGMGEKEMEASLDAKLGGSE